MKASCLLHSKVLFLSLNKPHSVYLNQINRLISTLTSSSNYNRNLDFKNVSNHSESKLLIFQNRSITSSLMKIDMVKHDKSFILFKYYSTESQSKDSTQNQTDSKDPKPKKQSKFKQFYSQYGPMFLVVHLTTVVMWIYGFFLISKQGYDITQLLNVLHSLNIISKEFLESTHNKIDNYKSESGWITGQNLKHFATAYMVYKVIAPFRYMVSIGLVRFIVKNLRARGIMKS